MGQIETGESTHPIPSLGYAIIDTRNLLHIMKAPLLLSFGFNSGFAWSENILLGSKLQTAADVGLWGLELRGY